MTRILRREEVQRITGLSKTSIWRLERAGRFPARRKLGARRVGWCETDVAAWLQQLEPAAQPTVAKKTLVTRLFSGRSSQD